MRTRAVCGRSILRRGSSQSCSTTGMMSTYAESVITATREHPNLVSGVMHCKEKPTTEYFDSSEQALHAHIESLIPHAYYLRVAGRSRDGQTLVIRNSGPNDPGTHYLLHEGTLQLIGAERPWLDSDNLANVHYVTYAARDGEVIPAFVTVPEGNPPFPMVVMPHGGHSCEKSLFLTSGRKCLQTRDF